MSLQVSGLLNIKNIVYVEITDGSKIVYQDGNPAANRDLVKTYPLNYSNLLSAKDYYVGELSIAINFSEIYTGILKKFMVILISNGIKMFLASFVILLIIQQLVTRHLVAMAQYTKSLEPGTRNPPLELERKSKMNLLGRS